MALKEGQTKLGVRFRFHGSRKHGAVRDKYWCVRHTVNGKQIEEGLGYGSDGMTELEAVAIGSELKQNKMKNKRDAAKGLPRLPESFGEMQEILESERRSEEKAAQEKTDADMPFSEMFERFVSDRESAGRPRAEIQHYRSRYAKWVDPVFRQTAARKICLFDLQRLVTSMKGKAAPSTVIKVIGFLSLCFNHSKIHYHYSGENPVIRKAVFSHNPDILKADNHRERYLTPNEARELLEELPKQVGQMAKLSLLCGFRASEIFNLKWADINFASNRISIRDTKSGKPRKVVMPDSISSMLEPLKGKNGELIFTGRLGQFKEAPKAFKRTVDKLKLNDGIEDRRQKIVFHSLRHTCGSWLVDSGVDLFTVQKVLGHKNIATTQRYVHSEGQLQEAANVLDGVLLDCRQEDVV